MPEPNGQSLSDRILVTSTELFAEHGVDKTSMRMIAESLNVTKAALYYHFDNKDDLHFQIQFRLISAVLARLREVAASDRTPSEKVTETIDLTLRSIAEHREAFTVLLREGGHLREERWAGVAEARQEYRRTVAAILQEGVDGGELDIPDVAIATLGLLGMCNWAYTWIDADGRIAIDELARHFSRLFLDGARRRA